MAAKKAPAPPKKEAPKKKEDDKKKDTTKASPGRGDPYRNAKAPAGTENAPASTQDERDAQKLSEAGLQTKRQVTEALKRSDFGKYLNKDLFLFNLPQNEQRAIIDSLPSELKQRFRDERTKYINSGGDTTYTPAPGAAVPTPGQKQAGFTVDAMTEIMKELYPEITKMQDDYVRRQQDANLTARDTPQGTVRYERDPQTGLLREITELSPEQKQLYDTETGADIAGAGKAKDILGGYDLGQAPTLDRQAYEDQIYQGLTRDINTRQASQTATFEQQMADRGLSPGSEAYNRAYQQLQEAHQNELLDARDQARGASGQEATDALTRWGQKGKIPVDIANSLLGLGKGSENPQAYGPPSVNTPYTDIFGNTVNMGQAAGQNDLTRRGQDINEYQFGKETDYARWKEQFAREQANKQSGGGGGGGGGGSSSSGFYSMNQLMGMTDPYAGSGGDSGGGGYQPSPMDNAFNTFAQGFTGGMNSGRSYQQPTGPQYQGTQARSAPMRRSGSIFSKGVFG